MRQLLVRSRTQKWSLQKAGDRARKQVRSLHMALLDHSHQVEMAINQSMTEQIESVQSLLMALEVKDSLTLDHSSRVAVLAGLLFQRLVGVSSFSIDDVEMAAKLHDIGKVGVPDVVLNKAGPLSPNEWMIIRSHSVLGERILQPMSSLHSILPAVRGHHERWDGKGYPDGLQGEAIPLIGRIVAVADAFDALTSDRPYRSAFSSQEACQILLSGAGSQWDPQLIEQFIYHNREVVPIDTDEIPLKIVVIDPVCEMTVIRDYAQARSQCQSSVYYFCSTACKEIFEQNPSLFV